MMKQKLIDKLRQYAAQLREIADGLDKAAELLSGNEVVAAAAPPPEGGGN